MTSAIRWGERSRSPDIFVAMAVWLVAGAACGSASSHGASAADGATGDTASDGLVFMDWRDARLHLAFAPAGASTFRYVVFDTMGL